MTRCFTLYLCFAKSFPLYCYIFLFHILYFFDVISSVQYNISWVLPVISSHFLISCYNLYCFCSFLNIDWDFPYLGHLAFNSFILILIKYQQQILDSLNKPHLCLSLFLLSAFSGSYVSKRALSSLGETTFFCFNHFPIFILSESLCSQIIAVTIFLSNISNLLFAHSLLFSCWRLLCVLSSQMTFHN